MLKFVVLSTQRSGSTLLVHSLDSHSQVRCYSEIFRPGIAKLSPPPEAFGVSYERYWNASLIRRFMHHHLRRRLRGRLIARYLSELYIERTNLKALGFKLMYNQDAKFPAVMEWLENHNVKVIHNIRENALKVIVSRKTAQLRGRHVSRKLLPQIKITLDPTELHAELSALTHQVERCRERCKRLSCLEVMYEPFVRQQACEARKIFDFLELSCEPLSADLVKMNSDSLQDILENYQEVAETLKNTEFEKFLD